MYKSLALLLAISLPAQAIDIKAYDTEDGMGAYVFRWAEAGVLNCWEMPAWVDMTYFNREWTSVQDTALQHNWPRTSAITVVACGEPISHWRTIALSPNGAALYTVTGIPPKLAPAGFVPGDIMCGEAVMPDGMPTWRQVTYNGRYGIAVCIRVLK